MAGELTITEDLAGEIGAPALWTVNDPPDAYGNTRHSVTQPHFQSGPAGKAVHTHTDYATPTAATVPIYNRPSEVRTVDGDTGTIIDKKSFFYDGRTDTSVTQGRLTRVVSWLNTDPGNSPETLMEYDDFGNIEMVKDANGNDTTTTYEGGRGLYPHTVINPLGHTVVTETDYKWGQPTSVMDPNELTTEYSYDEAGRPRCVALPGDTLADCTMEYDYAFATQPGEHSTVTMHEKQLGHPDLTTTQVFDALGRPRYTDTFRVVEGVGTIVRTNAVDYDSGGRVRARYHPYPASQSSPTNGATTFEYYLNGTGNIDPLGRVYETKFSDNTFRITEYAHGVTTVYDEEDVKTETQTDALGRVLVTRTFDRSGAEHSSTHYTYDGMGRVLTTRQNADPNPLISNTYDTLGRKTQTVDRDSGTWSYGYDPNGNLRWQDDPKGGQHVQICYDSLNRPVKSCRYGLDFGGLFNCDLCTSQDGDTYEYDDPSVGNSKGRLTRASRFQLDGGVVTQIQHYDARGRVGIVEKEITVDHATKSATNCYQYDAQDRIRAVWYPDGEIAYTDYDASGQPVRLRSSSGAEYINNVQYDIFGRAKTIDRGNNTVDRRQYDDAAGRHRLIEAKTTKEIPGQSIATHLFLTYDLYSPRGHLGLVNDHKYPSGDLSMEATYSYDFQGRLEIASLASAGVGEGWHNFVYDNLGNLTAMGPLVAGQTVLNYEGPKPHQVTSIGLAEIPVTHDANGNRTSKNDSDQVYLYTRDDRLRQIDLPDETVRFGYDDTGQMAFKVVESTSIVTRRYAPEVETTSDGFTMKWYMLGGLRVASQRTATLGWETASLYGESPVRIAYLSSDQPVLIVFLQENVRVAAGVVGLLLAVGLVVAPWRKKRSLGLVVRHGHVVGVALVFTVGTLPWPVAIQPTPVSAVCVEGCDCPTPVPPPPGDFRHYHFDHLGSTVLITGPNGGIVEQIRYDPYGEIRGRWNWLGQPLDDLDPNHRREFTGYETELHSGLQYANARFYDPEMGSFLSHDPMHEFMSPYSYVGGDPTNLTDPTGMYTEIVVGAILIGAAIAAAAIDAGVRSGDVGIGLKAGAFATASLAAGATSPGLQILRPKEFGRFDAAATAISMIPVAGSAYGAARSFESGNVASGVVGVVVAIYQAYGISQSYGGAGGNSAQRGSLSDLGGGIRTAGEEYLGSLEGYDPMANNMKVWHAANSYFGMKQAATWLTGASSGPVHYLGRVIVAPFVAAYGVYYEFKTGLFPGNERFPFDRQRPLSWLYDTPGDLIANTYGQLTALLVPDVAATYVLRGAQAIPGPFGSEGPIYNPIPNRPGGPDGFPY